MFAKKDAAAGSVLLRGDEIPEQLPHSLEPNCDVVEEEGEDGEHVLVALRAVSAGEALTVAAGEDEEYDEWEMDPSTGEMVRVENNDGEGINSGGGDEEEDD